MNAVSTHTIPKHSRSVAMGTAVAVFSFTILTGCSTARIPARPSAQPVMTTYRASLDSVRKIDTRRDNVSSVATELLVCIRDEQRNKEVGLGGAYIGNRDGDVRLQLRFAKWLVMDLALRGDEVQLWLPRKNVMYRGRRSEIRSAPQNELSLIAEVGTAHELFFPRAWSGGATDRCLHSTPLQQVISVVARSNAPDRILRRMGLSRGGPVADWVEVYTGGGTYQGIVRYDHYQVPPAATPSEGTSAPVYPGRITLKADGTHRSIRFDVQNFQVNVPLAPGKFQIDPGDRAQTRDLKTVLESKSAFWE